MIAMATWWNPLSWAAPFPVVVAGLFLIVVARAGGTYALGRLIADGSRRSALTRAWLDRPGFVRATARIDRWGAPAVAASFLTVGFQTMANLAAGVLRMSLRNYLPALALGGLAWALVYASAGFVGLKAFVIAWQTHPLLALGLAALVVAALVAFIRRAMRP